MTIPIINFAKYIEQKINDTDEKIFSAHFALYIQHDGQENTYPIDFDDVWKWCEFTQKRNAKRVLEKNFIKDKDYIINNKTLLLQDNDNKTSLLPKDEQYNETRGGQNKELIMLNIDTFKEFCMKASTPKSKIIRSYYIKLEKIFMTFTKEQLEYSKNQNKALEIAKNKTFKDAYTKQYVVYTMKLQSFENGSYIMKIGKTDDIKDRTTAISALYGCNPIVIMDVFVCSNNYALEQYLHKHPDIECCKYTELINNKVSSTEAYLIQNNNKYNRIKRIIEEKIPFYDYKNIEELKEKNKLYELQVKEKELEFNEKLYNENPELLKNLINSKNIKYEFYSKLMDNPDLFIKFFDSKKQEATNNTPTLTPQTTKTTDNIVRNNVVKDCGPLVQVYDGKDLTKILYVFNGITDAVRKMTDANDIKATISYTGIKNAAKKNEIYKGYRWNLISRNELDPKKVFKLEESHIPRTKLERLVAMLNEDKTIVEKVFLQQKEAGEYIQKCASVISIAINHKTMVDSKYFILWDMVEKQLQDKYLEQNKLPVLGHKLSGKQIQQIDPKTNKIIKTFFSITDLCKSFKISSKTAKKYAENNEIFKGFLWRFI